MPLQFQIRLLEIIINDFNNLSKNTISFNAISSILDNGLEKACEDKFISFIKPLRDEYLSNSRLIRVLESLVTSFTENKIDFIIDFVIDSLISLVKIRQGFFLIRKLCKVNKNENIQMRLVKQIDQYALEFSSQVNGSLLSQCIIRNFVLKTAPLKGKVSSLTEKVRNNIHKMLNTIKGKYKKDKKDEDKNSDDEEKVNDTDKTNNYVNPALIVFFDIIINKLLTSQLNKHTSKIIECALRFGGGLFHKKILDKLTFSQNSSQLIYSLFSNERGLRVLNILIETLDNPMKKCFYHQVKSISDIIPYTSLTTYNEYLVYCEEVLDINNEQKYNDKEYKGLKEKSPSYINNKNLETKDFKCSQIKENINFQNNAISNNYKKKSNISNKNNKVKSNLKVENKAARNVNLSPNINKNNEFELVKNEMNQKMMSMNNRFNSNQINNHQYYNNNNKSNLNWQSMYTENTKDGFPSNYGKLANLQVNRFYSNSGYERNVFPNLTGGHYGPSFDNKYPMYYDHNKHNSQINNHHHNFHGLEMQNNYPPYRLSNIHSMSIRNNMPMNQAPIYYPNYTCDQQPQQKQLNYYSNNFIGLNMNNSGGYPSQQMNSTDRYINDYQIEEKIKSQYTQQPYIDPENYMSKGRKSSNKTKTFNR
jgi:hypothetical protein